MDSPSIDQKLRRDRHPADLLEPGNVLRTMHLPAHLPGKTKGQVERHSVAIVGAGQAGLSLSYHLTRRGIEHVVLEGAPRIGDVWRNRWDSLKLFTPAKFDGLDGHPFPAGKDVFPSKDQMANYLEGYAEHFGLPVHLGTQVLRLHRASGAFRLETTAGVFEAEQVIIAAAGYRQPRVPDMAGDLDDGVYQIHSHDYRNPDQIPDGPVLLIGAGNSGAEIAMDLAQTHAVTLAGHGVGHVPFDIAGFWGRKILVRLVIRGLFHYVLTTRTPMGRRFRTKMHGHGMPLVRTRPGQLEAAGVRRVGRVERLRGNWAITDNGEEVEFASVIWCTGYTPGLDWIHLPVLDGTGQPRHRHGTASDIEGLYFLGLHFQYAVSSTMVSGVGRDARRIARRIAAAQR